MDHVFDVLVVGGGPAGYTAALYAARAGLDTLLLERALPGGQMTLTDSIENYPGTQGVIDGFTLGDRMRAAAEAAGAKTVLAEVTELRLSTPVKGVHTRKEQYFSKTVILAMGAYARRLELAREVELTGRGVSYCAHCDGRFFKDKTVGVVGGGESAVSEAIFLSRLASKVYLIHRRDALRASAASQMALTAAENVTILWDSAPEELQGEERLSAVTVRNLKDNSRTSLPLDALFISIGRVPETTLVQGQLDLDENGYILTDEDCATNVEGVFAAGDIRRKSLRQIVTAVADGAIAAAAAEHLLSHR